MDVEEKLYLKGNKKYQKCVNLDDDLYDKVRELTEEKYDATLSEFINICIEDYIIKNNPSYYPKKENVLTTNRSIMIRKNNEDGLNKFHNKTGISFTRLLNGAISEFIASHNL